MIKTKLPKDWISVTSKSHPDRIYYFNVKTNQSTWHQPTLDKTNEIFPISNIRCKRHSEKTCVETTPGHNLAKSEITCQQRSRETPQMKVIREEMLHKSPTRNKSFSSSEVSHNAYTRAKTDIKSKQQNPNKSLINRQRKHENNVQQRYNNRIQDTKRFYNHNSSREKEPKFPLRKNLARERMQRLTRSLNIDRDKLKEIIIEKAKVSKKLSTSLTNSGRNNSLESTCIYKNVEVRLKRLHNKTLKDSTYERNTTLNDNKLQIRQNKEIVINDTTKDKLIEQASQKILYEEMDWEPMEIEQITLEVEVVRTQLSKDNQLNESFVSRNTIELMQPNETGSQEKDPVYIVVDTNIFLLDLKIIEEARDATFQNYQRVFIVIPWTVIAELDYFKDNKSKSGLCLKARKAISFIHQHFSSKHPRVIGQTREQAVQNRENFSLDCPDDEILQCCLQILELGKSVVLLSNDKNLCTKAMIYNILALDCQDSLEKIDHFDTNDKIANHLTKSSARNSIFNEELLLADDVFEETKTIMKDFLSTIIVKQMSEIYGASEWKIYVIIKPPWTIVTTLKCAIKHWIAAISESFQRRAEYVLKDLLPIFENLPDGGRKLRDVEYILEKCSDLIQMVNMDKHYQLMTRTLDVITELKRKCLKFATDTNMKKLHDKIGIAGSIQEQEIRAEKVFQYFQHIYTHARDICGMVCSNAGIAHSFTFKPMDPPLSSIVVQRLRSEISKKVIDLTHDLNESLEQAEYSAKYQALLNLQHDLNTYLPDTERMTFDVTPLDVYCCIQLKEEALKTGLRQLQELSRHFCALSNCT